MRFDGFFRCRTRRAEGSQAVCGFGLGSMKWMREGRARGVDEFPEAASSSFSDRCALACA